VYEERTAFLFYSPFPINSLCAPSQACIAITFSSDGSLCLLLVGCLLGLLLGPEHGTKLSSGTPISVCEMIRQCAHCAVNSNRLG
jgi:hypothetical protein